MAALGKYTYNSGGAASSTPVTVTFDEWISNGYSKIGVFHTLMLQDR
jgi:hypothetical protein